MTTGGHDLAGSVGWWYQTALGDRPELYCYTSELSLQVGSPLELRIHSTVPTHDVVVYRDGATTEVVYRDTAVPGVTQPLRERAYRLGCDWDVTCSIDTAGWAPGGYVIALTAHVGAERLQYHHWISLRPERLSRERVTLIAATCTWNAYNGWGGASCYGSHDPNGFSRILSLDRPFASGIVWLPLGAPRESTLPSEDGSHVFYPSKDWAYSHGYNKHYASAGWATFERQFVVWAERQGYDVDVVTQHDLHFRPELLNDAGPVVLVGHDEYWTWEMRENLDAFIDAGGQVARLAGNFLWQVRLSPDGREQTCYRQCALDEDPVRSEDSQRHLLTHAWDLPEVGYPAAATFGVSGVRGIYAGYGGLGRSAPGGFTIYRPDHWMVAGAGVGYGDVLGARSRVATYELDGLDYRIEDGLPYATSDNGIDPRTVEIVGLCVASNWESDFGTQRGHLDVGDEDCALVARVRYGNEEPESLDRASRGSGVLAEYRRGHGRVISAAAAEWVNGLRVRDPSIEQVTRNILNSMLVDRDAAGSDA